MDISKKEELMILLNRIEDSYPDFVSAIMYYAEKKESRFEKVMDYLSNNPNVLSSDVIEFISDQPDFNEDVSLYEAV